MTGAPRFSLATVVLDCLDAHALADFYSRLLGWEVTLREPDWVLLRCRWDRLVLPIRGVVSPARLARGARRADEDAPP